ncbi:MAG: septal ring lytic transglycosylase RlpA family protein [Gammaproteobacteria bacterium]|nr:septal ring lytic transglycosylase RlpA family protein [Gammaproteobacteria bacterium]NNJ83923.1 septal ring lytic transglycosylase RlpA family protein [Gammaproteobacteria bacterium]
MPRKNKLPLAKRRHAIPRGKIIVLLSVFLTGCGLFSEQDGPPLFSRLDANNIPDAVPRMEPKSRYGNMDSYVVNGKRYYVSSSSRDYVKRGIASWYGKKFHGRRTSSGETYDMYAMTAAHRSLPLPTYVHVTNLENHRRAIVRVNDRGPFHPNRVIDLSYAAAVKLGLAKKGTARVEIRAIDPSSGRAGLSMHQALASAPAKESLYLQVGAFADLTSAKRLKTRLHADMDSAMGSAVRITSASNHGQTLYRVRLGPLVSENQADRLGETLAGLGFRHSRIYMD